MAPSTPLIDDAASAAQVPTPGPEERREPPLLGTGRVLVLVAALSIVALGLAGGLGSLALAFLAPAGERLAATTVGVAVLALTAGLGLPLAWHAWQAMQGRPSSHFRPTSPWPLAAAFLLAVAGGHLVLSLRLAPALLFPPFHVVAALAPPLLIVALVARGLGGAGRWRDTALQLSSGAFLAVPLAFVIEGAMLMALATLLVAGLTAQSGGPEMLQSLADALAENAWLQDPDNLLPLLISPGVVIAALLITALFVPLVEELVKAVGVALASYRRPDARQAMLWGLVGGAGFAMVEGLFNTTGSLSSWASVIVLRVGATLLHCTAGALMGLAWHQVLIVRRWGPALGLYAASAAMHAAWNTVSVGVAFLSLGITSPEVAGISRQLASVGTTGLGTFLIALAAAMAVLLIVLTRRLARRPEAAGEHAATPLPPGG